MRDVLAKRLQDAQAARDHIDWVARMRKEIDVRHRDERRLILTAAGLATPPIIRMLRDADAAESTVEQRRRVHLQDLADHYAAFHGDTPDLQDARRTALDRAARPTTRSHR